MDLGDELRALRRARRLSLNGLSARAKVSRATLANWEAGIHTPRGIALGRVLDALEADERTRARLLQACDPVHARLALNPTRLGAPIGPGAVIRGMRARRGATQADLARDIGVSQATVARWESGELVPSPKTLHAVGFALGASAEETVALAQAQGASTALVEWTGGDFDLCLGLPEGHPITEVVALGLEAELWRRAAHDARWEPSLCAVLGARASRLSLDGRYDEAGEPARRAIRLASTSEGRLAATYAFGALASIDRRQGGAPGRGAQAIGEWLERLPDSRQKAWMIAARAIRLASLGRADEAIDDAERMAEMDALFAIPLSTGHSEYLVRAWRCETELSAGRPDRAAAPLDGRYTAFAGSAHTDLTVRVGHALERAATDEAMEAIRPRWRNGIPPLWEERRKFARIEGEQRRLREAGR